jgi:hypothetical protein
LDADARPIVAIHQPECLPWLGFVDKIRQADLFVLLDCVQFEKNYFQNRNRIRTAAGVQWLTVPVLTRGRSAQAIRDVRINGVEAWARRHRQALALHYGGAPFYDSFADGLTMIYGRRWERLADFNEAVIRWIAAAFGLDRPFVRASALGVTGTRSGRLRDICVTTGARTYLSGVSGRDYLDESLLASAGIAVRYQEFRHPVYRQRYEPFVANLSAIDLLFNAGPEALLLLTEANTQPRTVPA